MMHGGGEGHAVYGPIKGIVCQRVRGARRHETVRGARCMEHGVWRGALCVVLLGARWCQMGTPQAKPVLQAPLGAYKLEQ